MIFREGTYITAEYNQQPVKGYVLYNENEEAFITGNNGLKVSDLKNIRISEAEKPEDIDEIVNSDLEKLDKNKVKNMKDADVEKVSAEREKEIMDAGIKVNKGDYAKKLSAGIKAMGVFSKVAQGDITMSDALKKYESSSKATDWSSFREGDLDLDTTPLFGDTEVANELPQDNDLEDDLSMDTPASADADFDTDMDMGDDTDAPVADASADLITPDSDAEPTSTVDDFLDQNPLSDAEDELITSSIQDDDTEKDAIDLTGNVAEPIDDGDIDLSTETDLDLNANDDMDFEDDDVEIRIKNPKGSKIEISIDGDKEEEVNNEVDDIIDNFHSENTEDDEDDGLDEAGLLECICRKYRVNSDRIIKRSRTLTEAICNVIEIAAKRR